MVLEELNIIHIHDAKMVKNQNRFYTSVHMEILHGV